ncbi:Mis12 protein-domain-containing protein [Dactylonectria estremocensis]|uniref:Mis12 protein-domain-containing protein n=1 Tax=Dactylonectria estremocensis TaxID=1079267 RepID=A0A9P9J348_9HYPO|nr:Mis12 protein-domain-containing protein [Dactylonectria estremocensis]
MAAPQTSDYELLTEHLGYPPVSLLDDIINTVNVLADRALDSVERLLLSIPPQSLGFKNPSASSRTKDAAAALPPDEAARAEIENGTHQLETLLNAAIDKNFDLFELYTMNNILKVRPDDMPYMRLAHYEGLDFAANPTDGPTPESITALRRRLHASQRLHVVLETERARNDALLTKLRASLGLPTNSAVKAEETSPPGPGDSAFGFLRDRAGLEDAGADTPITTTTEFTLSQLQALRALSSSLRTLLPDLGPEDADTPDADSAPRTWRRDRVEYVEAASRKYLENSRGLELGTQGEVRDGEWQGEGRKVTRNDVESLEQVASMLGNRKQGQSSQRDAGSQGEDEAMDES